MMQPQHRLNDQRQHTLYSEVWFETVFQALDRLHDDVCAGRLSGMQTVDVVGWLEDIIYTAEQTIDELRAQPSITVTDADLSTN